MRRKIIKTVICSLFLTISMVSLFVTEVHATEVSDLREEKTVAQEDLKTLTEKISKTISEIDEAEKELIDLGEKMIEAESKIQKAKVETKEQDNRVQKITSNATYENGNKTLFNVILDSGSMADLLKKALRIKTTEEIEKNELNNCEKKQEELILKKSQLEQDAEELEKKQQELERKKDALNKMISATQVNISELDIQIQEAAESAVAQSRNTNTILTNDGQIISKSNLGVLIVEAARSQLGVSYRWGGTTPYKGLDCSGLTQYCHKTVGISIARTSGSQRHGGKSVNGLSNALPGDIICYSGHVGIYIGDGQIIHAPQTGDVIKVSSVYSCGNIISIRRYW